MVDIFGELNVLLGGNTNNTKQTDVQNQQPTETPEQKKALPLELANTNSVPDPVSEPLPNGAGPSEEGRSEPKTVNLRPFGVAQSGGNDTHFVSYERSKESVFWIETSKIRPNPEQPRVTFDEGKIRALAESIRQYGILQPIVVSKREIDVPTGTQVEYQIVAGERRYRAAEMIGLAHMPAVIRREDSERIKLELALIENLQREDLQPLEKAHAYKRLVKEFNLTAADVGFRVGKSRESVANTMRLLMLPEYIQQALVAGHVTEGQARPLISLVHSPEDQRLLFERIVRDGLGAREIEQAARQVAVKVGIAVVRSPRREDKGTHDAATRLYETKLADVLGTRVSVKRTHDGKGKISIEFFSNEELQNLLTRMATLQEGGKDQSMDNDVTDTSEGGGTVVIHPPQQAEDFSTFTV